MNNQEFFTITVNHLRKQGVCHELKQGNCYRNKAGKSCAIGVHIPDSVYLPKMEGTDVLGLMQDYKGTIAPLFTGVSPSLLQEMQKLHDFGLGTTPDYWERRFAEIALIYKIQVPPCT
jgi:hypothetical protein